MTKPGGADDSAMTVIVTRRPKPGQETEFAGWNHRLITAARRAEGYLGAEIQQPDGDHPGEWVTIYRFDANAHLEAWLASDDRRRLIDQGADLIDGQPNEHRIAEPGHNDHPVTAVVSKRVPEASLDAYRRAQAELDQAMRSFPGFVRSQTSEPTPGAQDNHVTLFTFDSRENLDRWLRSDERRAALAGLDELIDGKFTLSVMSGFGGWFPAGERPTPRWKQAITVLIALFPTLIVLRWVQNAIAPDAPWLPALFISNVVSISILTWILMPLVTRVLAPWLRS